jgi:membrane-bound lytic murein transglycosylase D
MPFSISPGLKQRIRHAFFIIGSIISLALLMGLLNASGNIASDNNTFTQTYKIFPVPVPDTMSFAGERVPMNRFGIKENLEQEMLVNTYWQSQTMLTLKRTSRYFPVIEQILKKNGIPEDFKFLALAESAFSYRVSSAGAAGFWQLLKSTGESYGLEVTSYVDERYNLEKSTEAACRYFKDAYDQFHNWTLVAASYNMGLGGVEKELLRQKENNYYDLELNSETARYVYRILALKALVSNPKQYGYYIKSTDVYSPIPSTGIVVDSTISNLTDFALSKGINYRILKLLNPWLLTDKLPDADRRMYIINVPIKNVPFEDLGEYITFIDSTSVEARAADSIRKNDGKSGKLIIHIVKAGENLESIAKQYKISVERLCTWNSISDTIKLKPRDELMIFEQ